MGGVGWFFKYLKFREEYFFDGKVEKLRDIISAYQQNSRNGFNCKIVNRSCYLIISNVSVGVGMTESWYSNPIKAKLIIEDQKFRTKVVASTDVRIEHFIILLIGLAITVGFVFSDKPWYMAFFGLGLSIIVHFWFHIIYRMQEKALIARSVESFSLHKLKMDELENFSE
uniref:hypothetical protein n=1 Tax=Roseivirga sp. TaxID=1964215 RepID=UPI004047C7EF